MSFKTLLTPPNFGHDEVIVIAVDVVFIVIIVFVFVVIACIV